MFTARFTEQYQLLGTIYAASASTEQNSGYKSCKGFDRIVIIVHPVSLGSNALDVDIETGTDTSGTSAKTFDSGNKDITVGGTDTKPNVIEIKGSEFDEANAFDCLNVEITPAGSATFAAEIWGLASYQPASITNLDSVTD